MFYIYIFVFLTILSVQLSPIIAEFSGLAELKMKKFGKISTLADIKVKLYESLKR